MKSRLSKRNIVRIISFALVLIGVITANKIISSREINALKTEVSNNMNKNLNELITSVNNINLSVEKAMYCGTANQLTAITSELWKEAGIAKSALSQLPFSGEELTTINKFLSQIGDYSMFITKKMLNNENVTSEELTTFSNLSEVGKKISNGLAEISISYSVLDGWTKEINANLEAQVLKNGFGNSMAQLEETLTDYPTLIYDGPFSDKVDEAYAKALVDQPQVSKETARQKAAFVLSLPKESLIDDTEECGTLPSYSFKTNDTNITVSKQGGEIVYFRKYYQITQTKITPEAAIEAAYHYLSQTGNSSLVDTYYFIDEGVCTINFAYKLGDFICYSDLIKVGVALDTGDIILLDARGYLMNHTNRKDPTPIKTIAEAELQVAKTLTVQSVGHAIIPQNAGEKACYEFLCLGQKGEEVLVYINCDTLVEEKIMILLKTDGGTLTK